MKRRLASIVLALTLVFSFGVVVSAELPDTEPLNANVTICLCEDCLSKD